MSSERPLPPVPFADRLRSAPGSGAPMRRGAIGVLQVNVGKRCNQTCTHCHVDAGPARTEQMSRETAEACLRFLSDSEIPLMDITGGAPELCPEFERLVLGARALGRRVIDRCNLTVIFEPGRDHLPDFFRENAVELVCSLPCYTRDNVDEQRGRGVFDKSIRALQILNEAGYGRPGTGLLIDLIYNPVGASLPPPQAALEADYRARLQADFGIVFNRLLTLTNMPIARFARFLRRSGKYDEYLGLLAAHFNPATLDGLMCRSTLSVGYDGLLYDCDFNQMLGMPIAGPSGGPLRIQNAKPSDLPGLGILVGDHCYGCTAGAGSSCGGAIASKSEPARSAERSDVTDQRCAT